MSDYAKNFLEILKLAPRYLISLGIISAFLLFGADKWLKNLGIYDFAQHYRPWLALVLIVTSVLFGVDRCIAVFGWIRYRMAIAEISKRVTKRLHSLTEDEKQILRFYFAKQTKTNVLRFDNGVVNGLVAEGIIFQSSEIGNILEGFAYNITDFSWDYLRINPHLLQGTTNLYVTHKRRNVFDI